MRIAIIGTGVSGLTCAYLLDDYHTVTVFEASDYLGGHINTVDITLEGVKYSVDTGFIVYNEKTYPNFSTMLKQLDVTTQPSNMSFSVKCERTGLEYKPTNLNSLFGQRGNLFRPEFFRMIRGMLTFNRCAAALLKEDGTYNETVKQFADREKINKMTFEKFVVPMGSAIWSAPPSLMESFPIRYLARFYHNHGLLSLNDHPQWRVIKGGSREYIKKMTQNFSGSIRLNSRVIEVKRNKRGVALRVENSEFQDFDACVLASHSDQALAMLSDPTQDETEILSSIPFQENTALLHTDSSVLPKRKRVWASWNSLIPQEEEGLVSLTYNMNMLQSLNAPKTICVSLNMDERINPKKVIKKIVYHHPVYTEKSIEAQKRRYDISGQNNTYYVGAYWQHGFHEDGVLSAIDVCKNFGVSFFHE